MSTETVAAPGTTTDSTAPESSPSLSDSVGEMFGDYVEHESPAAESTDAGAPPAESGTETPDPAVDGSEAPNASPEHAGAPPAVAADAGADDPLASATPVSYVVNGETRTFEGLMQLGNAGAFITADHLPKLQQRLAERDNLFERSQQAYRERQQLEPLMTWQTRNERGEPTTVTGRQALEAIHVDHARTVATVATMAKLFDDPKALASLITVEQDAAGNPIFSLDKSAMEMLATRIDSAVLRAETGVRTRFGQQAAPTQAPSAQRATVDPAQAVAFVLKQTQITGLSPEDERTLTSIVPRFIRQATADDVAQNPTWTVGEPIVDPEFIALAKQTADLRRSTATTVAAASTASKENAARLAAAAAGTRPAAGPRLVTAPKAPTPNQSRVSDAADAWDLAERAGAAAIRRRHA